MKGTVAVLLFPLFFLLFQVTMATASNEPHPSPAASYLQPDAPVFDLNITQFRTRFNLDNPALELAPFQAIKTDNNATLVRAASQINNQLYASAALERGTLKIKSMQITWLASKADEQHRPDATAQAYISALIRFFSAGLTQQHSMEQLNKLLTLSEHQPYCLQTAGAVRYVLVTGGENELTFAVEPIKLVLSGNLPQESH